MMRALEVRLRDRWQPAQAIDRVILDADDRSRRRATLTGERGTKFVLDLPHPTMLHDGDGLVLEDGTIVRVTSMPEPLVEVAADCSQALARLAWHLGNRHTEMQVVDGRLRIRRDHILQEMLRGLGARLTEIEAPFDPEPGAYGHHGHE